MYAIQEYDICEYDNANSNDDFQNYGRNMCQKTTDLEDDIVYGKDDFYELSLYYMEDAEIRDDIVV